MSKYNSCHGDINERFDEKIKKLEDSLPKPEGVMNCAELTLTHILDILGIDNFFFHNLAIPLAGGLGGFKSIKDWKSPCGSVTGGCLAIGIIMGGQEELKNRDHLKVLQRAAKFASNFEKNFGSVACKELCGTDWSDFNSITEIYVKNKIWQTTCYKFVIYAINEVRKLTRRDLSKKWE
jgi:C_GCAxxG_C_C family probable redox protein